VMEKAFIGRQPIYREGIDVFAYELVSCGNELNQIASAKGDETKVKALLGQFVAVGLDRVIGPHPAFVNVTRDFILSEHASSIPKNGVVLQVPDEIVPDEEFMNALTGLSQSGYSVALDNFVYRDEVGPLAMLADIVKLNVRKLDRTTLTKQVQLLKPLKVKLLAEEVETHEDYQFCKNLGFDYFEGYFFTKPQYSKEQGLPFNRASTLYLLSKLQNPDINFNELEHAVGQDVAMSYRILRYLNSPLAALPRKVSSIRHAISLVGTSLIRQWASVIWLESIEEKPRELMIMAMVRAHMSEQLATAMGCKNADQFFTVGLLSLLDVLMDREMKDILGELPLTDVVKTALLERSGLMGQAVNCVEAYERCDWNRTSFGILDEKKIRDAYLSSVKWSRAVIHELVN
jgi:EAL and modified HD-GYP domain-containing signal transduction protein